MALICDTCGNPADRADGVGWIHAGRLLADRDGRPVFYPLVDARHFCSEDCQATFFQYKADGGRTQRLGDLPSAAKGVVR